MGSTFYKFTTFVLSHSVKIIFRMKVEGLENLPLTGPVILVSNHNSYLDPPFLNVTVPRQLSFMAKEELFRIPVFNLLIKKLGAFPVKRGKGDMSAIKSSLKILQEGKLLVIFPEGGRSHTDGVQEGYLGTALIAKKSNAPVIPTAIIGNFKWLTMKKGLPSLNKVTVRLGKPMTFPQTTDKKDKETMKTFTSQIMEEIRKLKTSDNF